MQASFQQIEKNARLIMVIGALLMLLCIAAFSFTGNYFILAIPFVIVIAAWVILDWKSFYWFFIFSIPLSAEIHLGSMSTTVPDEQMMWIFVPLTLLVLAVNYKRIPHWFLKHPITLIIFLQFVWLVVAVFFSQNHFLSFKFLAAKIWFLVSYLLVSSMIIKDKKDIRKAFLLFSIPLMVHAVFVFIWHGIRRFDYWDSNFVVQPFYFNHVDHSTVLSMMFPLMLISYQLTKGKKNLNRLALALVIFLIPAIWYTGARAAMLGVIFCLVINFAVKKRLVNFVLPMFYIFVASMAFYLSNNYTFVKYRPNIKYTATQRTFGDLMTATFQGTDMSSMERFYRWIAVARMSQDHMIVGVGPNNFYDYYKNYTSPMFKTWVSRNEEKSTTHNYFMFLLVEQGWPATILYAILMMAIFAFGQRIYHRTQDPYYRNLTMGIVMMLAAGFVNNFFSELWETHKIGAMFYLGIIFLILLDHLTKKQLKEQLV
ncbi:O-antigen ligase family protein [Taibaiella lutea]|uniref:O-antigen ligase family protein n=1 Tax=Taibaiella lutea TaxID=2608001 RepID=A0A5M6CQ41_9BACT|nr:O-antigen ligase family protein [Taibaiella lutea]KAA5536500.1 O-antigen ligase family protein [Taibaiella lutea]